MPVVCFMERTAEGTTHLPAMLKLVQHYPPSEMPRPRGMHTHVEMKGKTLWGRKTFSRRGARVLAGQRVVGLVAFVLCQ